MNLDGIIKGIGTAAKKGFELLMNAKLENVAKVGVFVGAAAYTAYVAFKGVKNRYDAYKERKNMDFMDEALDLNFADPVNREDLDDDIYEGLYDEINEAFETIVRDNPDFIEDLRKQERRKKEQARSMKKKSKKMKNSMKLTRSQREILERAMYEKHSPIDLSDFA
jgi:hypothetical protein